MKTIILLYIVTMSGYGIINRVIKTGLMIPYRLPHDLAISDVKATFLRIFFFNSCDWHSICRLPTFHEHLLVRRRKPLDLIRKKVHWLRLLFLRAQSLRGNSEKTLQKFQEQSRHRSEWLHHNAPQRITAEYNVSWPNA